MTYQPIRTGETKKITACAVLTALALIFSYVETLIPFQFGIPGIKLGLPNTVIIIALYTLGPSYAFTINILRILLSGFLFGNVFSILYALAGGLLSFGLMYLLKRGGWFSVTGVSMAGGVAHNAGQLLMAALVVANLKLLLYLPVLLFSGMISGILIGIVAHLIIARFPSRP